MFWVLFRSIFESPNIGDHCEEVAIHEHSLGWFTMIISSLGSIYGDVIVTECFTIFTLINLNMHFHRINHSFEFYFYFSLLKQKLFDTMMRADWRGMLPCLLSLMHCGCVLFQPCTFSDYRNSGSLWVWELQRQQSFPTSDQLC